jgi:Protein of unknown function (DUF3987)/CHC2 zinc finger/Toprim-like
LIVSWRALPNITRRLSLGKRLEAKHDGEKTETPSLQNGAPKYSTLNSVLRAQRFASAIRLRVLAHRAAQSKASRPHRERKAVRPMRSAIAEAKHKLPLPALLHRLGLGEHAKKSARCPLHEDRHNSFSVYKNAKGEFRFKCFAGCGEGDEINFLEVSQHLSRSDATKLFLEMARVNGATSLRPQKESTSTFNWQACVEAFTEKHVQRLAKWRGYSIEFCRWLRESALVGLFNSCIAFPVHDRAGNVIAIHYRLKDASWRYRPQGATVHPLVIGELVPGDPVYVFESYWDAYAFMDKSGERHGIIITRGASNGALVADVIPQDAKVYLWTQNDAAGEKWQRDICANAKATVKRARIPAAHKDLNDWTRAGGESDDLVAAMVDAEVIREAKNEKSESTESAEATQAPPFPLHCLPPVCEAMARAVCETARVMESLPGCCTLGIASAAIGAGLQVRSGTNRVTRPNLYMLGSAESGSGKSETFRHLAKPLLEFEAERVADWKEETKPGLLAEHKILEAEIANLTKSGGKPNADRDEIRGQLKAKLAARDEIETQLRTPILSCEDVTGEKLAVLLAHNREQLASLSSDALAVVNILLGRYNKLDRTDEGIYLKAFTGDRCKVDRQSRESVLLESPCLTALWLTQPDKLDSLLAERSLSDGGLIPRILCCHTHCEAREIVQNAPEIPSNVEKTYKDLIRSLLEAYRLANEPFTIEPTSDALDAMNAHHNAIVKRRRTDLRDVTIYAARWNEQAWRIAVVLHAGSHGAHAHEHKLEIDTADQAIEIADWFASQQLEILSAGRDKARREKWDRVFSLADEKPKGIKAADVYRARIVRNADEAHALLAEMEAAGELSGRDEQPETGGHVTWIFTRVPK